jgi:asparagine N-glycosylation enzyme membrane subunit Stt3
MSLTSRTIIAIAYVICAVMFSMLGFAEGQIKGHFNREPLIMYLMAALFLVAMALSWHFTCDSKKDYQ